MTKILAISDVHGEENENLYTYLNNNDIDLVLILGDITDFGPLDFVETFINKVADCNVDVIAIPGNCDPNGICNAINDVAFCLHNNIIDPVRLTVRYENCMRLLRLVQGSGR